MDWINIHVSALMSAEFLGSSPVERATWLCLLRYCVTQENAGFISECGDWKDRKWQQIFGITLKEARSESKLWSWVEVDGSQGLTVKFYPVENERIVQQKRSAGRIGGQAKTQAKTQASAANGAKGGRPKNPSENPSENPTERKGKESNRNGKEVSGETLPFGSAEFIEAWEKWELGRKQRRKPISPVARVLQFSKLTEMGERRAIEALKFSSANDYTGIFEPNGNGSHEPPPRKMRTPEEVMREQT